MSARFEERLTRALMVWVDLVRRHARVTLALLCAATVPLLLYAVTHLGVEADHKKLLSEDLEFQQTWREFAARFPTLDDSLLIVVDAESAELARESAQALAAQLATRSDAFREVFVPDAGPFFQRNGLLYRSVEELEDFSDQLSRVQPILAELSRDSSLVNLADLVRLGLERVRTDGSSADRWPHVLRSFGQATVAVYHDYPVAIAWEDLLFQDSAFSPASRRVIVAEPVLAFDRLLPAAQPIAQIRETAREMELEPQRGVQVRVTGNPALNHEEMQTLLWDVGAASLVSFFLVCAVLYLALRSWPLVGAAAVTLLVGLIWTGAFAAFAVGRLNLVSVAFAVLFVGLGVDFAIHVGMQYMDLRRRGEPHAGALREAVRAVGGSLVICTLTTAIGFYSFVPTDFRGVGELGLVAGTGMFVILFLTLTLFPALLGRGRWIDARVHRSNRRRGSTGRRFPARHAALVGLGALGVGAAAVVLLPRIHFDSDVVSMRNPDTESVQTFQDLLSESSTSPWYIDLMAPDLETARGLTERLRGLDAVDRAISLGDYVPEDQEEKIEILADAEMMLYVPSAQNGEAQRHTLAERLEALVELQRALDLPWLAREVSPLAASARQLRHRLDTFLARLEQDSDPEAALASLESLLLGGLPERLRQLRTALQPSPITMEGLPEDLVSRMLASDGQARIQVFPRDDLDDAAAMARFVDAVREISPRASGLAVNLVEFGRATSASLREALVLAVAAIAGLLGFLWRRMTDVGLVLAPLLLGAAITAASMVLIAMPFNFANVIVIPLLLGIGVDGGIHLVHRARRPVPGQEGLVGTATSRAVFYSAATTIASFGSLALSSHPGIASLGLLLVIGMVVMAGCNLLVLPALLTLLTGSREAPLEAQPSTSRG